MDCLYLVEKAVLVCPYVRELDAAPFLTSVSVVPADLGVFVSLSYRSNVSPVSVS
jgi:hypothetical protein